MDVDALALAEQAQDSFAFPISKSILIIRQILTIIIKIVYNDVDAVYIRRAIARL